MPKLHGFLSANLGFCFTVLLTKLLIMGFSRLWEFAAVFRTRILINCSVVNYDRVVVLVCTCCGSCRFGLFLSLAIYEYSRSASALLALIPRFSGHGRDGSARVLQLGSLSATIFSRASILSCATCSMLPCSVSISILARICSIYSSFRSISFFRNTIHSLASSSVS